MSLKKAALITIHGMGNTKPNFDKETIRDLRDRLKGKFKNLYIGSIYYQKLMQENEKEAWAKIKPVVGDSRARQFILYYLADALGLETNKDVSASPYTQTQVLIAKSLYQAQKNLEPNGEVSILAHSLGCQAISCYLWDANRPGATTRIGIWKDINSFKNDIRDPGEPNDDFTPDEIKFMKGGSLKNFITMGCNIPIFIAAQKTGPEVKSILDLEGLNFVWRNYYDNDDWLGWPLNPLLNGVKDIKINAATSFLNRLLFSWNTLCHAQYWGDSSIGKALTRIIGPQL